MTPRAARPLRHPFLQLRLLLRRVERRVEPRGSPPDPVQGLPRAEDRRSRTELAHLAEHDPVGAHLVKGGDDLDAAGFDVLEPDGDLLVYQRDEFFAVHGRASLLTGV